jgi:hypothetical protein
LAGDLIEVPARDARELKARKKAREPQGKAAKASADKRGA